MQDDNNKRNGGQDAKQNQLVITFDPENFTVNVTGHTVNMDIALAMLDMARRVLEARLRASEVAVSLARPMPSPFNLRGRT